MRSSGGQYKRNQDRKNKRKKRQGRKRRKKKEEKKKKKKQKKEKTVEVRKVAEEWESSFPVEGLTVDHVGIAGCDEHCVGFG